MGFVLLISLLVCLLLVRRKATDFHMIFHSAIYLYAQEFIQVFIHILFNLLIILIIILLNSLRFHLPHCHLCLLLWNYWHLEESYHLIFYVSCFSALEFAHLRSSLWLEIVFYLCLFVFVVQEFELKTLCLLGKFSPTWAIPPALWFSYFSDGVWKITFCLDCPGTMILLLTSPTELGLQTWTTTSSLFVERGSH
jgi:hypothetical protein